MKIPVVFLSYQEEVPKTGYWDHAMITDLLTDKMWKAVGGYKFEIKDSLEGLEGAVIVFPARGQVDSFHRLNADIAKLKWVVLVLAGDEEAVFPFELIIHDNIRYWVMSPKPDRHGEVSKNVQCLGAGYPPHARGLLRKYHKEYTEKKLDWFYSGQNNNTRRDIVINQLTKLKKNTAIKGELMETAGFIQGMEHEEYYQKMASAKIAVCPGGNYTPETFRAFEALEAGCYPYIDEEAAIYKHPVGYWDWFFKGPVPFAAYRAPEGLSEYITEALPNWRAKAIKVYAWWQQQKRNLVYRMKQDIYEISHIQPEPDLFRDSVTILIPTSPIPKHPSAEMISETIRLTRQWFPDSEIILMIDGIREEQQGVYKDKYPEYIREVLWKCNFEWTNVLPLVFETHHHQVAMTREALKLVKTPLILFVEHDCPLTPDNPIDMEGIVKVLLKGELNVIRFHHEALILPGTKEHSFDLEPKMYDGVPVWRTWEWSQRPHMAGTAFYKRITDQYFSKDCRTMYEDVLHGKITSECAGSNEMAWYNWRVGIYHPEGHLKRSSNFDGREDDEKFAEKYIF